MLRWSALLVFALGCKRAEEPPAEPAPVVPPTPVVAAKPAPRHQPVHFDKPDQQYKAMAVADPWPTGPFDLASELPSAFGTGEIGTSHRVTYAIADQAHRWAVLCQQRHDSDGDGTIEYEPGHHFTLGDRPHPYFVIGGGPGSEIEAVIAISNDGNRLVLRIDHATVMLDISTGKGVVLPGAGDAADFSTDGRFVLYVDQTEGKARVVRHEIATGATKAVPYPSRAGSLIANTTGRWALVSPYANLHRDFTTCSFGQDEPSYEDRVFVDLETGAIANDPAIVWPLGDRMLTRKTTRLALGGKPIGPTDCKELDVLAVHEATAGVLVHCTRANENSKRWRTLHYLSDKLALELDGRWTDRNDEPLPDRTVGTDACFRFDGDNVMCIDVTTGAQTKKRWVGPPHVDDPGDADVRATASDQVLLGPKTGSGPLRWVVVRDRKVVR